MTGLGYKGMMVAANELLDICAQIEKKAAEVYFFFGELYRDMPDLAKLWIKTAQEEENHMQQFQLAARLGNNATFTATVSLTQAQQALEMITSLQERLKQNPPTWHTALKFAIELEDRIGRFHTSTALIFDDVAFNSLYKAMMKNDRDHVQSLSRYLANPTDQDTL